jgi:hypothetical protein
VAGASVMVGKTQSSSYAHRRPRPKRQGTVVRHVYGPETPACSLNLWFRTRLSKPERGSARAPRRACSTPLERHGVMCCGLMELWRSGATSAWRSILCSVMSASPQQRDRLNVALAAVTCGRLSHAAGVRAIRGGCCACADQYGVKVTEPRARSLAGKDLADEGSVETVLEHWGGDAEMLVWRSTLKGAAQRSAPAERARVAARTVRDHGLDSLHVTYPDGAELSADRMQVVLYGPRQGFLRRRGRLVSATVSELL